LSGAVPVWRTFELDWVVADARLEQTFEPAEVWDPPARQFVGGIVAMV
jgi:hypothetical protein